MRTDTTNTTSLGCNLYRSTTDHRENPAHEAKIIAYCDGSSLGNPGPGGWAFIISHTDGTRHQSSGQLEHTTNNRAEIMAAIHALLALDRGEAAEIRADSEYVVRAVTEWRPQWEKNGWMNSKGQGIANHDLFKVLFGLVDARPGVRFVWVKGHHTDPLNNLCDRMARNEAEKAKECVR
jgi:ribonuclease HI